MAHPHVPHRLRSIVRSILSICAVLIAPYALCAQPPDSRGTTFWVVFMANEGSGGINEVSDLRLYLSADYPVDAAILYHEGDRSRFVQIPTPGTSVEISVNELFGADVELGSNDQGITSKVFQIVLDEEVSDADLVVSGANIRNLSGDAFLAFPEDMLGREYVVLSYRNGYLNSSTGDYDKHSEFAIIGTEDNTLVEIFPSAQLNDRTDTKPFVAILDRGEVLFAQAALGIMSDVSGTRIRADKPVAVLAGNQRTSVPTSVGNFRDHLVEQMIPVEHWGKGAIVTPFYTVEATSRHKSMIRVVATEDNTTWRVGGTPQQPLKAGEVREIQMESAVITAEKPIMVAAYEHSVDQYGDSSLPGLGDPFMMLVPSPEQYDSAYVFHSIPHREFTRHFINVTVPTTAVGSMKLDGAPLEANFQRFLDTEYYFATIELPAGSHSIRADAPFGLMVYGYGQANSYGYIGGMRLPKRPSGVEDMSASLAGLSMRAVPQPAREGAAIELTLSRPMRLSLALFDLHGEKVVDVADSRPFEPGLHVVEIDLTSLSSGTYMCRLTTETGEVIAEKIVVER